MALLDSMLAENFHAAYRQKRSGVLTAEGALVTMRYCFQDGSPVAIDLGDHKDHLLALTLRDYNRLTEEQLQEVLGAWQAGRGSVADLVVANNYASEEEVGRSTQAMVEDSLCHFFAGKINQVTFDDLKTIDGFDFDRQAFRLKIDAEVLLRTIDARVSEVRTIQQEFGSFHAVYAFNEDSPGSGELNDYEKRILDFVDGKKGVHEIAVVFRDSDVNTARTLGLLAAKRIIRRVNDLPQSAGTTGVRPATAPSQAPIHIPQPRMDPARGTAAEAAIRTSTPTMRDFTPYRRTIVEEPKSRFTTVILVLVLALLCAVGVLVYQYQQKLAEFRAVAQRLEDSLQRGEWIMARQQITEADTAAGQDLSAQERVKEMEARFQAVLAAELAAVDKLATAGDWAQAGTRLAKLPVDPKVDEMRGKVQRGESASRRRAQDLASRVAEPLDRDDARAANALFNESPLVAAEKIPAADLIDRWRVIKVEQANSANSLLTKRMAALALVRASDPPQRVVVQLAPIEADIAKQQARIREQIAAVKARLDKGEVDGAVADIARLDIAAQVEGTTLAVELGGATTRISEIRDTIAGLMKTTVEALVNAENPERLAAATAKVQELTASPLTGVAAQAAVNAALLKDVAAISTSQAPDVQAAKLLELLDQRKLDPQLAEAMRQRGVQLRARESIAANQLENARALARDSQLEAAVKAMDELLANPQLRSTAARATASQEIDELKARQARRVVLQDKLKAAIAAGDVAAGNAIAREMGLKYLPLAIDSLPQGAEVWHAGKQVGSTPLVLDISAADRVDYEVEIRAQGYKSATASGAKADAGWRLLVHLERDPAVTAKFDSLVTNHPVVVGDAVVVASRGAMGTVDAAGKTTWQTFGPSGVDSPLYAGATVIDDELLFGTRDLVALAAVRKDGGYAIHRVPLTARTDFPLAAHRSSLIVDRRLLLVAGLDGALHATDERDPSIGWNGPSGAPLLSPPAVFGDVVAAVRADGTIERLQADDGKALAPEALGRPAVAAWATATGLAGYTAGELFEYDGQTLKRTALPQPAADGVQDLVITAVNRVLVRTTTGDRAWDELGKLEGKLTGRPLVWEGHAVLPIGGTLLVLGKRGFRLTAKSDFLSPVVLGKRLVAITQDGEVFQYEP